MKYECSNGHIFDEDEMITVKEDRGEFWGMPCSEELNACPYCKDTDIGEYNPCATCKKKYDCENSSSKMCEECEEYEEVRVNGLGTSNSTIFGMYSNFNYFRYD